MKPIRIEPERRLVVLARVLTLPDGLSEERLVNGIEKASRFGPLCLGQALYRHDHFHRDRLEAPPWTHVELTYFLHHAPLPAIKTLVTDIDGRETLLRAELLLATPRSFIVGAEWPQNLHLTKWKASLEFLDVKSDHLDAYSESMRDINGPAATTLVERGLLGTFRAMETATVLYQDTSLDPGWNQLHLFETEAETFARFPDLMDEGIRAVTGGKRTFNEVFGGLDDIRTVRRWSLNTLVADSCGNIWLRFDTASGV